ncbi:MAG: phospholipase D-like domain-containing protein [Rhizorhabdus sp.]
MQSNWRLPAESVVDIARPLDAPTIGAVHFGGPDQPPGALSKLLLERIDATPAGQRIDWATYYFRDLDLARALIAASDRGVKVRLVIDGDPRLDTANDGAIALLKRDGLNGGLVVRGAMPDPFDRLSGKLHTKIYAFSWPRPVALVGSFNPSGDEDTDAATIAAIGDQDRGHNLLVELTSHALVGRLVAQVDALARNGGSLSRFAEGQNHVYRDRDTALFFYPRLRSEIVEDAIDRLVAGDRMWAAMSHVKGATVDRIAAAARRGVDIDIVVHDTERRVPQKAVDAFRDAGVRVRRYHHPDRLPMHAKFIVMETEGHMVSWFGSLNYNRNSRLLNDELLVRSANAETATVLLRRFAEIDSLPDCKDKQVGPSCRA